MDENTLAYYEEGFLKKPKIFWNVLIALLGTVLCCIPNWINTTGSSGYIRNFSIRFNFLNLFGSYNNTNLYFLFGENITQYNFFKIAGFVVAALLAVSFVLLILSLINIRKRAFVKLALAGLITACSAVLAFMVITMIFSGEIIASGLTAPVIAAFIIPLVTIPVIFDPVKIKNKTMSKFLHQKAFFFMIIPVMVYVFIFNYLPLKGWEMAFQMYKIGQTEQEWVGLFQFRTLFSGGNFWRIMQNTLGMSVINLVLSFSTAIFFALMINELRQKVFKRVVQTISYLPHFLSWVIAAAMIGQFLSTNGVLNQILVGLGVFDKPKIFLANPDNFWWIVGWSGVWKSVGWNTIIYLAAITSIDPELYESAELDGAGRFAKMWNITLPGIKSTILVLLIMSIGWILNAGYEVQFLLGNDLVWPKAETIDVFVIRWGIANSPPNYSLATALGMFKTVVSVILITGANQLSKTFAKESLV